MSAEDELLPQENRALPELASPLLLAEFRDDAESDQRNLEIIGWWPSLIDDDPHRPKC